MSLKVAAKPSRYDAQEPKRRVADGDPPEPPGEAERPSPNVVARVGRASEQLHLTPQSISGQLRVLEESLGETLTRRKGRNLELTDAGRLVLDYANEIFALGDDMLIRMPRRESAVLLIENESMCVGLLARSVSLPVPMPIAVGQPGDGYPYPWSIVSRLPGRPVGEHLLERVDGDVVRVHADPQLLAKAVAVGDILEAGLDPQRQQQDR